MSRVKHRTFCRTAIAPVMLLLATSVQAQELPKGAEILKKSVEAMGGEAAIRNRVESHMTGTFEVPSAGLSGTLEVFTANGPSRMLTVIDIPGAGTVRSGFDGKNGWSINPMLGTHLLTGNQLEQLKQQADQLALLAPDKYFKSIETVEKTTFAGKDAYKVRLTTVWDESYHEFYDTNTGLQLGSTRTLESPMGAVEITSTLDEWKEFGGIKVPTLTRQAMMGAEQVIKITNVEYKALDPKVFELPAEVKALIK